MPHLGPIFEVFKLFLYNQWLEFNSNYENLVRQKVSYVRPSIVLDNCIIVIELSNLKVQKKFWDLPPLRLDHGGSYKELILLRTQSALFVSRFRTSRIITSV